MEWANLIAAGACVVAAGLFLVLRANSLATNWQSVGRDSWGGTTDTGLRQTYHDLGLLGLVSGLVLLGMAAWRWTTSDRLVGHQVG